MVEFNTTVAASLTIGTGIVGLFVNICVGYAVRRCKTFGHAFGSLCFSQTVANVGNICVFVFLTGGMTFIEPEWHKTYIGRRSGQLLIFFWEASIFTHLFISMNRAIAVNFPIKYNVIFHDKKTTTMIVALIWFIAALQAFPYTLPSCSMKFHPGTFTYEYSSSFCGRMVEQIGDLYVSIAVVTVIGLLDLTSFFRLHQLTHHHTNGKAKAKELRLFFQACTQAVLLMFCECSFFYLSSLSDNMWYAFASTTFIWVVTHFLDGVIVFVFSREIRSIILNKQEERISGLEPSIYHTRNKQTTVQPLSRRSLKF
ncbi:hypothetical protein L596_012644 [Steinernema carpocapsae]|nr:hypothetical protein L596_012644 [Steinernema carpocapsae]